MRLHFAIWILLGSALTAAALGEGFGRYQAIIDRRPFGEDPPEEDTVQVAPTQSFAKNLRLSMLFEGPNGDVRIGIVDNAAKSSFILKVGESENGIELIEADLEKSEAMLKKGNQIALLKLKEGAVPVTKTAPAKTNKRPSTYAERRRVMLQKIEAQKKKEEAEQPQLTGEALRKHLEQVQMNAIREGLPPLPMPLTPEMDAQLVSEGVLPPQ